MTSRPLMREQQVNSAAWRTKVLVIPQTRSGHITHGTRAADVRTTHLARLCRASVGSSAPGTPRSRSRRRPGSRTDLAQVPEK